MEIEPTTGTEMELDHPVKTMFLSQTSDKENKDPNTSSRVQIKRASRRKRASEIKQQAEWADNSALSSKKMMTNKLGSKR